MLRIDQSGGGRVRWPTARTTHLLSAALTAAVLSTGLQASDLIPPPELDGYFADAEHSAAFADLTLHYLNELSARRRLTTVFPNEQSPFYGVQLNYVNLREGNLTFLMRDMVRAAHIPIVFGRIYDSRKQDEADFGRGWKLSVVESLERGEQGLLYTDASNSTYELQTDGSRLWSEYPHLTGIRGGTLSPDEAIILAGALTKIFERQDGTFKLVEVRDRYSNWLRFGYTGDSISRISSSSGRYVSIERDQFRKIVAARDDAGRSTRYSYDQNGNLTESFGIDGGTTRYRYDGAGFLSKVVDPRGIESIDARFQADGKVAAVNSQHDEMNFAYDTNSTTVRNAQQQASIATYDPSGLIESVTDFAGGLTSLEFDADLRVKRLSFDGSTVATAAYEDGRLIGLNRVDPGHASERRFYYDEGGRLTAVVQDGQVTARYEYDKFDRVVSAEDSSHPYSGSYGSHGHDKGASEPAGNTVRRYRFDGRGNLRRMTTSDLDIHFEVNRLGMIERAEWDENKAIDIGYADIDRVRTLRFDIDGESAGAQYQYDGGGFRVSGRYDVLEVLGDTEILFDYDSTGNLIRLEMPGVEGRREVIRHTIGPQNQLLLLTPVGAETFEQAIEYDESGRAVRSVLGGLREAAFHYDELGRLTDVYLDRNHLLTSNLGPMDLDPVHASDDYSAYTASSEPVVSGVFGSLDEIVYTRPFGTPYGVVQFVPEMARLVVLDRPVVPPDSLIIASLRRRNLASEGTLNASPLLGFDKPSSSLFVPPEFFTSNCAGCAGGATGFDIDRVGSGPIVTGQTITFEANAGYAYCTYWWLDDYYELYTVPNAFFHDVSFLGGGGSGSGTYTTATAYKQFSGSYSTAGPKTVEDILECSCGNIFLAQAQRQMEVCSTSPAFEDAKQRFWGPRANLYQTRYQFSAVNNTFSFSTLPGSDTVSLQSDIESSYGYWNISKSTTCGTYNITAMEEWRNEASRNIIYETAASLDGDCARRSGTAIDGVDYDVVSILTSLPGSCGPRPEVFAHELGHVLGFGDSDPAYINDIMKAPRVAARSVEAHHAQVLLQEY